MNEESKTQQCGDTCSVVASMASTFKTYVPKEQRMTEAIKAVQSGKMSQRAAAEKFDVHHTSIGKAIRRQVENSHHPAKTQSQPQKQAELTRQRSAAEEDKLRRTNEIRNFARAHDMNRIDGKLVRKMGAVAIYNALIAADIDVPDDIKPRSLLPKPAKSKPKATTSAQANDFDQQGLHANDPLPEITSRPAKADSDRDEFQDHPAFQDNFDIDAVRQHVNHEVQQSDRPADFKRAIQLLTELDRICTDAWYRRHPEPWGHDDWAHVSSEIAALHSIVGQRAEETADELLRKSDAVEIKSTVIC